jgi:hypothetical protein
MSTVIDNFKKLTFADGDLEVAVKIPTYKTCVKCGVTKRFDEYRLDTKNNDNIHAWCNRCERQYHRNYYKDVTKLKVA